FKRRLALLVNLGRSRVAPVLDDVAFYHIDDGRAVLVAVNRNDAAGLDLPIAVSQSAAGHTLDLWSQIDLAEHIHIKAFAFFRSFHCLGRCAADTDSETTDRETQCGTAGGNHALVRHVNSSDCHDHEVASEGPSRALEGSLQWRRVCRL